MTTDRDFVPLEMLTGQEPAVRLWRTLDELNGAEDPAENDDCEARGLDDVSRRRFLQLAAASFAFGGITGCTRQPTELILPYVDQPENLVPGRPKYYATAVPFAGLAQGVIVESHMGRPTKVEGNPDHPASYGATSVHSQASVLDLYDPDRSKTVKHLGVEQDWDDFMQAFSHSLGSVQAKGGNGLRILTGTITSPTMGAQMRAVLKALPGAKWHQFDAAGPHSARAGAQLAFGRMVNTCYAFEKADVVVALDSDFLACGEPSTRYARDFAARRVQGDRLDMNRLYAIESTMTATGGKADHRLPLRYTDIEGFTQELALQVGVAGVGAGASSPHSDWVAAIARDLQAHPGASIVIPGPHQSPAVHALAHAVNERLANFGKTVFFTDPVEADSVDQIASLRQLVGDMDAGAVELLLILETSGGPNPAYDAPGDFDFLGGLSKVRNTVHLGLYENETSDHCEWHIPQSHFLEEWGDARAFDGTITIMQPLIEPLYDSRSALQVLDFILQPPGRSTYNIVRDYWQANSGSKDFEHWWRKSVHDGLLANSALPQITPKLTPLQLPRQSLPTEGQIEIVFRPDPYMYDGRFANNTWLEELPQPMTKLTWDNAVYLSPKTARRLGLISQNRVDVVLGGNAVEGDVWVLPGHPDESVTVHLGWGRTHSGRAGNGAGFDAYKIRTSDALWSGFGVQLRKLDKDYQLATTQLQQSMKGRDIVISADLADYKRDPGFVKEKTRRDPSKEETLYSNWDYKSYSWGMSIDLTRCVNCNACVVACQAENNIPVVGKEQVQARRAMHWLRIDVYYEGDADNPRAHYQPVPCMQCEDAPCELVCPVQATNHSSDGLNDMVYNRCIGTRYCSNNCPYKVRRFNFVLYQDWVTESLKLQRNPDVTVRSRGVMEKCTYCVQRIRETDIQAKVENRSIRDGEIQTACQQACPTQAIVFGDLNQPSNHVSRLKAEKLDYALLGELNTRPHTTYLAELRNPNPELREA